MINVLRTRCQCVLLTILTYLVQVSNSRGMIVAKLSSRYLDTEVDCSLFGCIGMLCP